ncbi:MAG: hypothetical protein RI885_187 [Actinomycetota bacterium]|jgi:uncharacterized short protein YbdD (DUF466 family)
MSALAGTVVGGVRRARWFITSLMGDRAYDVYVAHRSARHPELPAITERQFWIERYREQESSPQSRCC